MCGIARWDQKIVVPDLVLCHLVADGFFCKNETNAGAVLYGFVQAIAVMHLELQIGTCWNPEGVPGRPNLRQMSRKINSRYVIHRAAREVLQVRNSASRATVIGNGSIELQVI